MTDQLNSIIRARRLTLGQGRRLRTQADLSVDELAGAVGVTGGTLSRWERGLTRPRGRAATRWLAACEEIRAALDVEVVA